MILIKFLISMILIKKFISMILIRFLISMILIKVMNLQMIKTFKNLFSKWHFFHRIIIFFFDVRVLSIILTYQHLRKVDEKNSMCFYFKKPTKRICKTVQCFLAFITAVPKKIVYFHILLLQAFLRCPLLINIIQVNIKLIPNGGAEGINLNFFW